ncbi:MAG: methyltransferase domain-containing protein [Syntrophorhabdales bacterium]|jgi:SAM-dependent methyltransferase
MGLYSEEELTMVPEMALSLSRGCGNPSGFADIRPGDTVVDFGCGGGIDVILAAHKVGAHGRVTGIDFAEAMIRRAHQAVAEADLRDRNIELLVADMERTHLPDAFADVLLSNCVINLCPDKDAVYKEAFRILRPGGRIAISDVVLTESIAPDLRMRFQATWAGCLGGAVQEEEYWQAVRSAGFAAIRVAARYLLKGEELAAMACCPGEEFTPPSAREDLRLVEGKVASVKFTATKPS